MQKKQPTNLMILLFKQWWGLQVLTWTETLVLDKPPLMEWAYGWTRSGKSKHWPLAHGVRRRQRERNTSIKQLWRRSQIPETIYEQCRNNILKNTGNSFHCLISWNQRIQRPRVHYRSSGLEKRIWHLGWRCSQAPHGLRIPCAYHVLPCTGNTHDWTNGKWIQGRVRPFLWSHDRH